MYNKLARIREEWNGICCLHG